MRVEILAAVSELIRSRPVFFAREPDTIAISVSAWDHITGRATLKQADARSREAKRLRALLPKHAKVP